MNLPQSTAERRLLHRRAINVQVYARDDGLFDVEAALVDSKGRDIKLSGETRRAGEPVHDMLLVLVVDAKANILEACARSNAMPYPGACDDHGDAYQRLVGLNLFKGFRPSVKDRLAGIKGCTHLTELCQALPTAVVQAFTGEVINIRDGDSPGQAPFQLDKCHALRRDGPMVLAYYPNWYRKAEAAAVEVVPNP